jgi:hypothetical protein
LPITIVTGVLKRGPLPPVHLPVSSLTLRVLKII